MRDEVIQVGDGKKLMARIYEPAGPSQGSVVIGGAMGVRQDFYAAFAQWMAGQGWRVTTFDYRGSGDSVPDTPHGRLRGFKADLYDWTRDYETVIDHAHAARPDRSLCLLGHSLGAQLPGRRLKMVGDLPAGVMLQWRKWCLNPRCSVGAEGEAARQRYASATFPSGPFRRGHETLLWPKMGQWLAGLSRSAAA